MVRWFGGLVVWCFALGFVRTPYVGGCDNADSEVIASCASLDWVAVENVKRQLIDFHAT